MGTGSGTPRARRVRSACASGVLCVSTAHPHVSHARRARRAQAEMVQHFADMYADKGVDEAIERAAEYQRALRSMRVGHRLAAAGA